MPIGRSAKKSLRKSRSNQKTNVSFKNKLKEAIKAFLKNPTDKTFVETQSILDKSIKNNIWHKNKVARVKSSLLKKVGKGVVVKEKIKKAAKKKPVRTVNKMA